MSQDYVLKSEKYVRKLEKERDELLEAAKRVVRLAHENASPELIEALLHLNSAAEKAEGRE